MTFATASTGLQRVSLDWGTDSSESVSIGLVAPVIADARRLLARERVMQHNTTAPGLDLFAAAWLER